MSLPDQTKARLLEAAGEEFAEKGFSRATIRSICARAGVNLAAVNYHFGDKEQLYLQTILLAHRCGQEKADGEEEAGGTPLEDLRRFIHHYFRNILDLQESGTWQRKIMLQELVEPTAASELLAREVFRPRIERLVDILRRARPGLDEARLRAIAFSVVGQCLFYKITRPFLGQFLRPDDLASLGVDALVDHVTRFTTAALGLSAPIDGEGGPP